MKTGASDYKKDGQTYADMKRGIAQIVRSNKISERMMSQVIHEDYPLLSLELNKDGGWYLAHGTPVDCFWKRFELSYVDGREYAIALKPPRSYPDVPFVAVTNKHGEVIDFALLPKDYYQEDYEKIPMEGVTRWESRTWKKVRDTYVKEWLESSQLPLDGLLYNGFLDDATFLRSERGTEILSIDNFSRSWPPESGDSLRLTADGIDIHTMGFRDSAALQRFCSELFERDITMYNLETAKGTKVNLLFRGILFADGIPTLVRAWDDGPEIHTLGITVKGKDEMYTHLDPTTARGKLENLIRTQDIIPG